MHQTCHLATPLIMNIMLLPLTLTLCYNNSEHYALNHKSTELFLILPFIQSSECIDRHRLEHLWRRAIICERLVKGSFTAEASILGSQPPDCGQGLVGSQGVVGSWTGREMLLYRIMYRKYVRRW